MPEYSIQRFRNGFAVVYADGEGKRRRQKLAALDRASAEAEARQRWQLGDRSPCTVGRIVAAYLADRRAEGIVTAKRQDDAWKAMRHFWENVDPGLIDRAMARRYADQRAVSVSTIRYELSMLAVALRWAKRAGLVGDAPEIWRPSPPERVERHLSHDEFERFYGAVRAPHARLYMLLGIYSMARPSSILDLTWDRVDFERGEIDLNPRDRKQTRKRRPRVPLNAEALSALRTAYEARQSEYVIERGATKVACVKKAFQAASKRSGVYATPYSLRHTGAVWAAEAGVPMPELAQFMGHDDSRTTEKHYARFTPGHLRRVSEAVQRRQKAT